MPPRDAAAAHRWCREPPTPGPGPIVAGDVVDISLRWDPADWTDTWVEKVLNCVSVDGTAVPGLSDEERPAPNDGAYARELVVPEAMEGGHLLCQQGFVYGMFARGGYTLTSSPRVCFTTEAAPPPPTTTTTEPPTTTTTAAPTTTTTAAPAVRVAAGEPVVPPTPVPVRTLPKTGPHDRLLLLSAGGAGGGGPRRGRRRSPPPSPPGLTFRPRRRSARTKGQALGNPDKWEGLPPEGRNRVRGGS